MEGVTTPELPRRRRSSDEVSAATMQLRNRATVEDAALAASTRQLWWFPRTVADVIRKADRDRLLGLAAESAFFSVLTLFPALLVVAAVIGQLGTFIGQDPARQVEDAVLEFLDRLLTDAAGPAVSTVRRLFDGSTNLLTLASALALASLSTAFATLVNTLTIAYGVPETRGWWRRRWIGLVLGLGSVLTGALAVSLLVLGPVLGSGSDVVAAIGLDNAYGVLWRALRWPVGFLSLVLWAMTMQHLAPPERHRWRQDLPGGLLTALLWLAASAGLNVYLTYVVTASPLLGALGGGLILMTWFYLLCVALLAGGTLNAVLAARRRWRVQQRRHDSRDDDGDSGDGGPDEDAHARVVEATVAHIESGAPTGAMPAPAYRRVRAPRT
jgi:membrane protein